MNIVVDQVVAVLQVLALGDAIRSDEHIRLSATRCLGIEAKGRARCKGRKNGILPLSETGHIGIPTRTRDESGVHSMLLKKLRSQQIVEIVRRVRKGGEDDDLAVRLIFCRVEGIVQFLANEGSQKLQFSIPLGVSALAQLLQNLHISPQVCTPALAVNIP